MSIYQHFRPSEKEFIDQVIQWKQEAEQYYQPKLTDFLDPRQQLIVQSIVGTNGEVKVEFFGGFQDSESKRAIFHPEFIPINIDDFAIQLFEVHYPSKFVTLSHRHVLGSLMSLGVRRNKYGDIVIHDNKIQFAVSKEIADYIKLELQSIGKHSVSLTEVPYEKALINNEQWQIEHITASSLRLDVLISAIFRLSRQKSQELIKHGLVKVNWAVVEEAAFVIEQADVISVRGHGRAKVLEIEGKTKKDKWRIVAGRLK